MTQDTKGQQAKYYRESVDAEFETTRPHGCGRWYNYLMEYKMEMGLRSLPFAITGQRVLVACCGSGMDAEFIARHGARVVGLDLSRDAVRRARTRAERFQFALHLVVGDAEHLPFRDGAVVVCFVHDGLHHLSDPHRAIRELLRVARGAVLLIEPAAAAITRVAVRLGLSEEYEEAGNYVYRFSRRELVSLFHSLRIRLLWMRRYVMYYHHEPRWYYRLFDRGIAFRTLQVLFVASNALLGRWGNKLMCLAIKDGSE